MDSHGVVGRNRSVQKRKRRIARVLLAQRREGVGFLPEIEDLVLQGAHVDPSLHLRVALLRFAHDVLFSLPGLFNQTPHWAAGFSIRHRWRCPLRTNQWRGSIGLGACSPEEP